MRSMGVAVRWLCACVAVMSGCGGSSGSDAGVAADASDDGGSFVGDGGPEPIDAGRPCPAPCSADQACLRGVCVASCGASMAGLEGAVADHLTVVANVCRTVTGPLDVVEGSELRVYDLATSTTGTTTTFTLSRWELDPATPTPAVETVATTTYDAPSMDVFVFASGYVAVSPDETSALFGYTTSADGYVGGQFDVTVGDGSVTEIAAPGNFDAAWIDEASWVVNGLGLEDAGGSASGLYLRDAEGSRAIVTDLGTASGSVDLVGDVIVAGGYAGFGTSWPDGTEGGRVLVLDRAAALAAPAPLSAWDDAIARLEGPSAFELLSGMRLAAPRYDESFALEAIEARPLSEVGGTWTLGAAVELTHGDAITDVRSLPGGRLLMVHAGGVLIVQE